MIVDDYLSIRREKRLEILIAEGVRMAPEWTEDHQIRHIHDTYTEGRNQLAEESSCCNHLKGNLCSDSNKDTAPLLEAD